MNPAARKAVRELDAAERRATLATDLDSARNTDEPAGCELRLREHGILEDGREFFSGAGPMAPGFLVDKLWAEAALGWIAGEPKVGKTWLILELIVAITTGRAAFGEFGCDRPGRVLYAAEEGNRARFQERLAGLCSAYAVPLGDVQDKIDVIWRRHVDLLDKSWQRDLEAIAPGYRAIFLDPFRDMHDTNEDRVHEVKPVLDFLRKLQEQGPAVAAVMHRRKQRDGDNQIRAGQRIPGTRHFHSVLDSAIYLDADKPTEDWPVKVSVEHRDEETIDPFHIELEVEGSADQPNFRLRAETAAQAFRGQHDQLRARAVERARELKPPSRTKLAESLGIQKKVALAVVRDCFTKGLLVKSEGQVVPANPEPLQLVPDAPEPAGTAKARDTTNPHGDSA